MPSAVRRETGLTLVAALPVLTLEATALAAIYRELLRAQLFHMGTLSARWTHEPAERSTRSVAAALASRVSAEVATAHYGEAFNSLLADNDPRPAKGVLRRAWRLEVWTALLETELPLGPEISSSGQPCVPQLAIALANALEAPTVDFAVIGALRVQQGHKPLPFWERHLDRHVCWRGERRTWREIVRIEARALTQALTMNTSFRTYLWGVEA